MKQEELQPLIQFCTPRQREYISANHRHRVDSRSWQAIGYRSPHNGRAVYSLKEKAGTLGYVPGLAINQPFPDSGNVAKGYSRWFKTEDGGFLVKTDVPMAKRLEVAQAAIEAMTEQIKPLPPIKRDSKFSTQLDEFANVYFLSDIHIGALAWHEESGADWDLSIAEQNGNRCVSVSDCQLTQRCACDLCQPWRCHALRRHARRDSDKRPLG